jgi:hypothetical protein
MTIVDFIDKFNKIKAMPIRNSPTNKTGDTVNTMLYEYIVVCGKR